MESFFPIPSDTTKNNPKHKAHYTEISDDDDKFYFYFQFFLLSPFSTSFLRIYLL